LKHNFTSFIDHPPLIDLVIIYLINKIPRVDKATINPSFPIFCATAYNFNYNGVNSSYSNSNFAYILPAQLLLPTPVIIYFP